MTHFGDPDFSHHKALGLLWISTALSLLTDPILTGKAADFGFIVSEIFQELSDNYEDILENNGVTLGECAYVRFMHRLEVYKRLVLLPHNPLSGNYLPFFLLVQIQLMKTFRGQCVLAKFIKI